VRGRGQFDLARIRPIDVAAYIEGLQGTRSKPTVKQHLAALRILFDWLVFRENSANFRPPRKQ
jgi:hypothetical protein